MAESNKLEGDLTFVTSKVHMKVAFMRECVWYTVNRVFSIGRNHQDEPEIIDISPLRTPEVVERDKLKALSMLFSFVERQCDTSHSPKKCTLQTVGTHFSNFMRARIQPEHYTCSTNYRRCNSKIHSQWPTTYDLKNPFFFEHDRSLRAIIDLLRSQCPHYAERVATYIRGLRPRAHGTRQPTII